MKLCSDKEGAGVSNKIYKSIFQEPQRRCAAYGRSSTIWRYGEEKGTVKGIYV